MIVWCGYMYSRNWRWRVINASNTCEIYSLSMSRDENNSNRMFSNKMILRSGTASNFEINVENETVDARSNHMFIL